MSKRKPISGKSPSRSSASGVPTLSEKNAAQSDQASFFNSQSVASRSTPSGAATAPSFARRIGWVGFGLVLVLAVAWVVAHAYLVDTVTVRLCNYFDQGIPPEKRLPVFLAEIAFDGYVWNYHAERLGKNGNYRLRFTDLDNAPWGREVHWNSAFAWYLRGLGELHYALTKKTPGASLRKSIFRMSIWANPILLVAVLLIFGTLTALRFGPLSGTAMAVGMVAIPTFYEGFMPAYPDHHGIIAFFHLGMLLGVAWGGAGWVNRGTQSAFGLPRSLQSARHGMVCSALFGAAGLWCSALSTSLVLATFGVAALVATWIFLRAGRKQGLEYHPELWKTWALWGCGGSLFFYCIEYFPNHLSMRLEVNHPAYALAFLGGGWAMYVILSWLAAKGDPPFPWRVLILCVAACTVLPVLIYLGGPAFYIPNDPFMSRLWKHIAELLPLLVRIRHGSITWEIAFGWFPILVVAVVFLQFFRNVSAGTKTVLVFMTIPILLLTGLQFYQTRWGLLVGPLYGALAAIVIPQIWHLIPSNPINLVSGSIGLLSFAFLFVQPAFTKCFAITIKQFRAEPAKIPISPGEGLALLHRQMARTILDDAGDQPVVLLSSPNSSCLLAGFGGFPTIGTLYWENVDGLKNAARALNAQSDEETVALLRKHGVTHVSLMTWENFIEPYFYILHPEIPFVRGAQPVPSSSAVLSPLKSFGIRALFQKTIPQFTRPLVFPPNSLTAGLKQNVLLLRVAPDQSPAQAKFHLARYVLHVQDNPVRAEFDLLDLENDPEVGFEVNAELGMLYLKSKRHDAALSRLLRALDAPNRQWREHVANTASQTLLDAGKPVEAKQVLAKAASAEDATFDVLTKAAWCFCTLSDVALRDPAAAAEWIARAAAMPDAKPARILVLKAAQAAAQGQFVHALQLAREAQAHASEEPQTFEITRRMIEAFSKDQPWVPNQTAP